MAKGFSKEEGEAKNARIGEIIEGAIAALQDVGLDHASVLRLLLIQTVIRMDAPADASLVVKQTLDGLAGRHVDQPYEQ
jgi:hypothetical protein